MGSALAEMDNGQMIWRYFLAAVLLAVAFVAGMFWSAFRLIRNMAASGFELYRKPGTFYKIRLLGDTKWGDVKGDT